MKKYKTPEWLDDTGREFYRRCMHSLNDRVNPSNREMLAVLADVYSEYRKAEDPKLKKSYLTELIKLAGQFGMTPRSDKMTPKPETPVTLFPEDE